MKKFSLFVILLSSLLLASCGEKNTPVGPADSPEETTTSDKVLEDKGDYSIYYFKDNRQCEKTAYESGVCPEGGIKITGYDNEKEIFCVITGGDAVAGEDKCAKDGQEKILNKYYDDYIANLKEIKKEGLGGK